MTFSSKLRFVLPIFSVSPSVSPSAGEMGMVSRGTGLEGSIPGGGDTIVAMMGEVCQR